MDNNNKNYNSESKNDSDLDGNDIQAMSNFVRAAKKKASLKTGKTNAKELHDRLTGRGSQKIKSIRFNEDNIEQTHSDHKPLTQRKDLKDSMTKYVPYVSMIIILERR
jgi:hypothetical protein